MSILFLMLALFFYLIPSIVACSNKKRNSGAITVLNILLGWSGIAWIICLVWAFCRDKEPDIIQVFDKNHPHTLGYVRGRK